MTPTEKALQQLEGVAPRGEGAWAAKCPAHEDDQASLLVVDKHPKGVLVYCSKGCDSALILERIGMSTREAAGLGTKKKRLRMGDQGVVPTFYDYKDAANNLVYQKVRLDKDGSKTFYIRRKVKGSWKMGRGPLQPVPFRLPEILGGEKVYIVEGEKAACYLEDLHLLATTFSDGGDSAWHPSYGEIFKGREVTILPDFDEPGAKYAKRFAKELTKAGASVRVVELPGLKEGEDVVDFLEAGNAIDDILDLESKVEPFTLEKALEKFALSEEGNADRFVDQHGDILRYCADLKTWLHWDGGRWSPDETMVTVYECARKVLHSLEIEALEADTAEEGKDYQKHIKATARKTGLENMISLASRRPGIALLSTDLDDPETTAHLLSVANGVIDLRTGELLEADKDLLISRSIPIEYDPEATCPRWERFVSEIREENRDEVEFFRRWLGYCLTGHNGEHKMMILHGNGSNGKTMMLQRTRELMGSYGAVASIDSFQIQKNRSGPRDDLAVLKAARLVVSSEADDGSFLDESVIKLASGGDALKCRHLYGKPIEYVPRFKLNIMTNPIPRIRGTDHGIWRRIIYVEFTRQFPQDLRLEYELAHERQGILTWLVQGAIEWFAGGLRIPVSIQESTESYRRSQDPIGGFLEDWCVLGEGFRVLERYLVMAYRKWSEERYEKPYQIRTVRRLLDERGITAGRQNGQAYRYGIGLEPAAYGKIEISPPEDDKPGTSVEPAEAELPFF